MPPGAEEFYGESRGDLRRFARTVIDAGAALVVGHGPHVVRGLELYRGHLIAYSLGNFATYAGMNLNGPGGITLVLQVTVAPDGSFQAGKVYPAKQERPGGPRWDPDRQVIPILRTLSREDFGPDAVDVADDGTLLLPPPPPASAGVG
ncbi:MAG: CapA family protein [Anaeromyxobacter sp.]